MLARVSTASRGSNETDTLWICQCLPQIQHDVSVGCPSRVPFFEPPADVTRHLRVRFQVDCSQCREDRRDQVSADARGLHLVKVGLDVEPWLSIFVRLANLFVSPTGSVARGKRGLSNTGSRSCVYLIGRFCLRFLLFLPVATGRFCLWLGGAPPG